MKLDIFAKMADSIGGTSYVNQDTGKVFKARKCPSNHSLLESGTHDAADLGDILRVQGTQTRYFCTDVQGSPEHGFSAYTVTPITHTFTHQAGMEMLASLVDSFTVPTPNDSGLPANQQVFIFFTPNYCPLTIGDSLTYNGDTYRVKRSDPCGSGCRTELVVD